MATTIPKQSGWLDDINTYISNNEIVIVPWATDGITMLNGCTLGTDTTNNLHYRIVKTGKLVRLDIAGWFTTPALTNSQSMACFTIPSSIVSQLATGFTISTNQMFQQFSDTLFKFTLNTSTNEVWMDNRSTRNGGVFTSQACQLNMSIS